jgi:hypothetical protein
VSANSWFRVEARVRSNGVGASHVEWWLYKTPDAPIGSHDETKVSTVENTGADVGQVRWGQVTNTTTVTSYHDDVAVATTQLGPSSAPVTPAMQPRRMPLGV